MPTFHSPRNPDFKLWSSRLPQAITFVDGVYSTDDPDEIKALRRHVKAGVLTEGEFSGEFHRGGVVPNAGAGTALLHQGEAYVTLEQAQALGDDDPDGDCTCGPNEACSKCPPPGPAAHPAPDETPAPAGRAPSNRELRERCAELGIQVPERAGKRALLDAIEIAERQQADAEGDDFDPNDPEGS